MSGSSSSLDIPQPGDPNYLPPVDTKTADELSTSSGASTAIGAGTKIGGLAAAGAVLGPVGALVGGAIGAIGAIFGANDQAEIDRRKAALEEAEAQEVARREAVNDAATQSTMFRQGLDISSEMAGSGHEGGAIGTQLEIRRQGNLQIRLNDEAAAFQESQLRAGAQMQLDLAGQTETAGILKGIGYGFTAMGSVGRQVLSNAMTTEKLPSIGGGF